ncbi:DNA-directed RNA polymerase sigma-70 factor [Bacteroidia bacterium]|nr:DNA-directed RNA polymerase sigma-70 factor [Bacteroidia bacterium]
MKFHRSENEFSETDVISGCNREDNVYRRYLYDYYAPLMKSICYRYTGDKQVAEDLLHDGFIRVFDSIHIFEYRGNGSLKAWMSRIFMNVSLEYLRKIRLQPTVSIDEYQEQANVPEEDLRTIPTEVLMHFVAELPDGYRTVFNLYIFEEMPHKEIAEILHIHEGSSRSQLLRAKALLTKKVNEYLERRKANPRKIII